MMSLFQWIHHLRETNPVFKKIGDLGVNCAHDLFYIFAIFFITLYIMNLTNVINQYLRQWSWQIEPESELYTATIQKIAKFKANEAQMGNRRGRFYRRGRRGRYRNINQEDIIQPNDEHFKQAKKIVDKKIQDNKNGEFDNWGEFISIYNLYGHNQQGMMSPKDAPFLLRKHKTFWEKADIDKFYKVYVQGFFLPYLLYTIPIQFTLRYEARILAHEFLTTIFMFAMALMCFNDGGVVLIMFQDPGKIGLYGKFDLNRKFCYDEKIGNLMFAFVFMAIQKYLVYWIVEWGLRYLGFRMNGN